MWRVESTEEFGRWFAELNDDAQVEIIAKVELLKQLGPDLRRPHADTLNGSRHANMKELRGRTAAMVLRVAFAFDPARHAVLLIGGNKAGISEKRFYKMLIHQADDLYDVHLDELKKKGRH